MKKFLTVALSRAGFAAMFLVGQLIFAPSRNVEAGQNCNTPGKVVNNSSKNITI